MHIPDKFHLMLFFNSTENWGAFQISVTEPSVLFCNMMNDLFCHVDSKSAALERLRRCICCAVSVCRLCALCVAHIRSSIQWFQLSIQGLLNIAPYMSQEATWRWRKNRRGGLSWGGGVLVGWLMKKFTADEMWNKEHRHLLLFPSATPPTSTPPLPDDLVIVESWGPHRVSDIICVSQGMLSRERERERSLIGSLLGIRSWRETEKQPPPQPPTEMEETLY